MIDPDVPTEERRLLAVHLATPTRWASPNGRADSTRDTSRQPALLLGVGAGLVFATGQVVTRLITQLRELRPFSDSPSPAPVGWCMTALSAAILLAAAISYLRARTRVAWRTSAARTARRHRGRFVTPEELDVPARRLLHRAQQAVDVISGSGVYQDGLLDDIRHGVVLGAREWEIAATLRAHTRLRTRQANAQAQAHAAGGAGRQVAVLLAPQRQALHASMAAITTQVAALESYAHLVQRADAAYRARRTAYEVLEQESQYREVLARTVTTSMAVAEIDQLAEQAGHLARQLREANRSSGPDA